jgi:hypothetical protein
LVVIVFDTVRLVNEVTAFIVQPEAQPAVPAIVMVLPIQSHVPPLMDAQPITENGIPLEKVIV